MSIINDGETTDLTSLHYKSVNDFTGKILFYTLKGEFINGWHYSAGKIDGSISPSSKKLYEENRLQRLKAGNDHISSKGGKISSLWWPGDCEQQLVPTYGFSCVSAGTSTYCQLYQNGSTYVTTCHDSNDGGTGGTGNDGGVGNPPGGSGTPQPTYDCAGVMNGSAVDSPCGCIGGTTGITECQIKDKLDGYPCAKALVAQFTSLSSDIGSLIKNTFGKSEILNLVFQPDSTLIGTTVDGNQNSYTSIMNGTGGTFTVGLNPDVLKNATKEYILVTMYHEALHAYLRRKFNELGATQFALQYQGLTVNGGRLLAVQDPQHWTMGYGTYVNGLRDVILAYNPNFGSARATALAECGIIVLDSTKTAINKQERNVNVPGYQGTKCP